MIQKYCTQ